MVRAEEVRVMRRRRKGAVDGGVAGHFIFVCTALDLLHAAAQRRLFPLPSRCPRAVAVPALNNAAPHALSLAIGNLA